MSSDALASLCSILSNITVELSMNLQLADNNWLMQIATISRDTNLRSLSGKYIYCTGIVSYNHLGYKSLLYSVWYVGYLQETLDSRGKQQTIEFAAYEVRLYCEMLLKGAVNMFEVSCPIQYPLTNVKYFL